MYTEQQTNCYKEKKQSSEGAIHEGAHLGPWGSERALLRKPQGEYVGLVYSPPRPLVSQEPSTDLSIQQVLKKYLWIQECIYELTMLPLIKVLH